MPAAWRKLLLWCAVALAVAATQPTTPRGFNRRNFVIGGVATLTSVTSKNAATAKSPASQEAQGAVSRSALEGFASGAVVSIAKQLALFPIDTVKTRLQAPDRPVALFQGLYNGVLPPLLISAPSGAVF